FVSAGIVFTTSSVFQGIGNTLPPLFSSLKRLGLPCLRCLSREHRVLRFDRSGICPSGLSFFRCALISCCSGTNYGNESDSANRKISFPRARPHLNSRARQVALSLHVIRDRARTRGAVRTANAPTQSQPNQSPVCA